MQRKTVQTIHDKQTSRSLALFDQARNLCYRAVKKKQAFYKAKFQNQKCDIKGTWQLINSLLGKRNKPKDIT